MAKGSCASDVLISPRSSILTDESTANNGQSLLLKLPQEIKDRIYEFVCGGELLHFRFALESEAHSQDKLCHHKCLSKTTEEDAQANFDASESPWFDDLCANRHKDCLPTPIEYLCEASGDTDTYRRLVGLDLRFLRTCHQIYDEARNVCYKTNIFSFDGYNCLVSCVNKWIWVSYIRSIRICNAYWDNRAGPATDGSIYHISSISSKLIGLQRIYIDLEEIRCSDLRRYDQGVEKASPLTKQLLSFARPALKAASVVITDAVDFYSSENEFHLWISHDKFLLAQDTRWTMTQKQEYTRFLRNALLQHRGKETGIGGETGSSRLLEIGWMEECTPKHGIDEEMGY